ncbi:hypothetical protein [Yaravirus sp. 'brasiliensis']|uniref:Uncharacterized protein n=1 Tax=Yaravirus sp. 'brasiliensis' TaxID=2739681 RepID=A0AAE7B7X0_9VIRU|nr:hypothetical protein QKS73_gp68 [Yaravirus brasiliensis]QKE44409.1 hypothetical protein [Yaravirus brasiliensis]
MQQTQEEFIEERVNELVARALSAVDNAKLNKEWRATVCLPADLSEWEQAVLCATLPYATLVEENMLWIQLG